MYVVKNAPSKMQWQSENLLHRYLLFSLLCACIQHGIKKVLWVKECGMQTI